MEKLLSLSRPKMVGSSCQLIQPRLQDPDMENPDKKDWICFLIVEDT